MVVLAALLSFTAYAPEAQGVGESCTGKDVFPSQNLPKVAQNSPPGTTFCIHDGTYKISTPVRVESNDTFAGVYSDSSKPHVTTDTAYHIFGADDTVGATIRELKISGAVGNDQCEPDCGRGIGGGENLTVVNVRVTDNMNSGIGGTGPGLLVKGSIIDHNGSLTFSKLDGGPSSTSGIKSVNSLTVLNSTLQQNWWNGVWCDGECNTLTVKGSTITDNGKAGIAYEMTSGPTLISGNIIKRNGWNDKVTTKRAGLLMNDSDQAEAYSNTFGGNYPYGVQVADSRERLPDVSDIWIHHNTMNGDSIVGCSISGVTCESNN
jgi:hypothetical protein